MPFCGIIYNIMDWRIITSYFFSMDKYGVCGNATSQTKDAECMYIDGQLNIHENIAGYINSSKGIGSPANYDFMEYANDKYDFMPRKMKIFVGVAPIATLNPSDEILVHYNINKRILACKIRMDSGDPNVFIKPG